jgi:hypothetical protein
MTETIAIIGTAGRKEDSDRLSKDSFVRMVDATIFLIEKLSKDKDNLKIVSGGAAWADHLAVYMVKQGVIKPKNLTLYLPADIKENGYIGEVGKGEVIFFGKDDKSGKTADIANYYHRKFSKVIGTDTLKEILELGKRGATLVPGDGIFHSRNSDVAKSVTPDGTLIAFTFGSPDSTQPEWTARQFTPETKAKDAELKDGGTSDTWNKAKCHKIHVRLG